jgi:hypothetical protein
MLNYMKRSVLLKIFLAATLSSLGGWASADPARIDLLMIYTQAARQKAGGTEAAQAKIAAMVKYANEAYARSDAGVYINLLDTREVNYKESGDGSEDLNRIIKKGDGYLEEVQDWRNALGADVVGMMADGAGGVGFRAPEGGDAEYGYVFWIGVPTYGDAMTTLAHELGHVLGAGHHWDNPWNAGEWSYSHGQVSVGQNFAYSDIMVSGGGLPPGVNGYPQRYPGFSNPRIYFDGVPTGIAEGQERAADNARTMRQMGVIVADYRAAKSNPAAPEKITVTLDQPVVILKDAKGGATFFAKIVAAHYPSLQWQSSNDQGLTWTDVEDTAMVSGSRTANLSIVAPAVSAHGRQYRLLASDSSGVTISDVATLLVGVPVTTKQDQHDLAVADDNWQEIVPKVSHIAAIDVALRVTGKPPTVKAYLETLDGQIVAETKFSVSAAIPETDIWVTLPFNASVSPDATYRLRLALPEIVDTEHEVRWYGTMQDSYPAGRSRFNAAWDMTFRVYGYNTPPRVYERRLGSGWHLLGNGSTASMQIASQYGDANAYSAVRRWNSSTSKWSLYIPGLSAKAMAQYAAASGGELLGAVGAGEGYWVNVKSALVQGQAPSQPRSLRR